MYNKVGNLQDHLHEINDYITRWVHEIKIPISVCELIMDKITLETDLRSIGKASENLRIEIEKMKFLIDQVLYASRASHYVEDFMVDEINLEKMVKEVVKKNSTFFISKNITVELDNLNFNVLTDRKWILYILQQILNNAYKYLDYNGKVRIYGVEDDKTVKLKIRDNGVGIAPEDIRRVFDKGFTGENGRRVAKSTGMALYYSKKIATKLGHDIEVSSQEGQYTEFTIIFYKLMDYFKMTKM